jgi:uncharacterized protein (TIGR04255 family)
MPEASDTPRFEPVHDAHAIEQVLFGVQLRQPTDKAVVTAATKVVIEQFGEDFPGRSDTQSVVFQIASSVETSGSRRSEGKSFSRTRPNGAAEHELRFDQTSVAFMTTAYTRWQAVWAQASKYFAAVLPFYLSSGQIGSIALNYVDKFVWKGDPRLCRASKLFRAGSRYLCPHVFDTPDLWHSHTGAFLFVENHTKRLINVNADCLDVTLPDEVVERAVTITTLFTDNLLPSEYDTFGITAANAHDFVGVRMRELHVASKKMFGDIVSDEIRARIALTD